MMLALALLLITKVQEYLEIIKNKLPHALHEVSEYFQITYIRGQPKRGRKRTVALRYPPERWKCYEVMLC